MGSRLQAGLPCTGPELPIDPFLQNPKLTFSFMVGEVAHFLPTVTSKALANSIGFGDMACYSNMSNIHATTTPCSGFKTREGCGEQAGCVWMFRGEGWEYQVLAGPAFIITFTISGVLMGFLADRISRPRLLGACVALFSSCCAHWFCHPLLATCCSQDGNCPRRGSL